MQRYWLKFSDVMYISFTTDYAVGHAAEEVEVMGPTGKSSHIHKTMTLAEAREYWRELVGLGWRIPLSTEVPSWGLHEDLTYGR